MGVVRASLVVAQAVTRGSWLLVEDLNLAPPDVLAALVPLLEGGALHLSHRSQVVRAAPGFQFIASVTTAPGEQPTSVFQCSSSPDSPPRCGCFPLQFTMWRQCACSWQSPLMDW